MSLLPRYVVVGHDEDGEPLTVDATTTADYQMPKSSEPSWREPRTFDECESPEGLSWTRAIALAVGLTMLAVAGSIVSWGH